MISCMLFLPTLGKSCILSKQPVSKKSGKDYFVIYAFDELSSATSFLILLRSSFSCAHSYLHITRSYLTALSLL